MAKTATARPARYPQLLIIGVGVLTEDFADAKKAGGDRMAAYKDFIAKVTSLCQEYGYDDPNPVVDFVADQQERQQVAQLKDTLQVIRDAGIDPAMLIERADE